MSNLSRRRFLATSAAALASTPLLAIDPVKRPGQKADIKLGLAAYSFRLALDLKKPTMTLFDFLDYAATLPLDAVELTSYYFAETTDAYIDKLKAHAAKVKLTVAGLPVRNDFCLADAAKWKAEVEHVKDWTRRAGRLGAKTVRVFAGKIPKGDTLEASQKRVVAGLEECLPVAEKEGVLLALENHGGITDTPEHLLALVQPVKSANLGVNVDTGNFHTPDPYADLAKIVPYGVVAQVKTETLATGKPKEETDLKRVVAIFRDANFHGTLSLEHEAAEDPKVAVPRYVKQLRALIG